MKFLIFLSTFLTIEACEPTVPNIEVDVNGVDNSKQNGLQYVEGKLFSGYLISFSENGKLAAKKGFLKGKQEGKAFVYFANGQLKEERLFKNNLKTGIHRAYYSNGSLRFYYRFEKDLPVGVHKEYYANGQLFSLSTYNEQGKPEGVQQQFFESGKIKANYKLVNGRRFGLLGAKGCMGENEREENDDFRFSN